MAARQSDMFQSFFVKADENQQKLQNKISAFKNEKKELEANLESTNKLVKMYSEEKDSLRGNLEKERKNNEDLKSNIEKLTKQLKETEEKLSALNEIKEKNASDQEKREKLIKKLYATNTSNKTELEKLTKENQKMISEKRRNKKRIESFEIEMQTQLKTEKELRDKLEETINQHNEHFANLEEQSKCEIEKLHSRIDEQISTNENLIVKVNDLTKKNLKNEKTIANLEEEKTRFSDEATELQNKCGKLELRIEGMQRQIDNNAEIESEFQILSEENKTLCKKIEDMQIANEAYLRAHDEQCKIFDLKIRLREEKIRILEDKNRESYQQNSKMPQFESKIDELKKRNQDLEKENSMNSQTVEFLTNKLKQVEEVFEKESKKFESFHSMMSMNEEKVKKTEILLLNAKEENEKLMNDIVYKDEKIKELLGEIEFIANIDYDGHSRGKKPRISDMFSTFNDGKLKELENKLQEITSDRDKMLEENIRQMDYIDQMSSKLTKALLKP